MFVYGTGFEAGIAPLNPGAFAAGYSLSLGAGWRIAYGRNGGLSFKSTLGTVAPVLTFTTPSQSRISFSLYLALSGTGVQTIVTWGTIVIKLATTTSITITVSGAVVATLAIPAVSAGVWYGLRGDFTLGVAGSAGIEWNGNYGNLAAPWSGTTTATVATSLVFGLATTGLSAGTRFDDLVIHDASGADARYVSTPPLVSAAARRIIAAGTNSTFSVEGIKTIPLPWFLGAPQNSFSHGWCDKLEKWVAHDGENLLAGRVGSDGIPEGLINVSALTQATGRSTFMRQIKGSDFTVFVAGPQQPYAFNWLTNTMNTLQSNGSATYAWFTDISSTATGDSIFHFPGNGSLYRYNGKTFTAPSSVVVSTGGTAVAGVSGAIFWAPGCSRLFQLRSTAIAFWDYSLAAQTNVTHGVTVTASSCAGWVEDAVSNVIYVGNGTKVLTMTPAGAGTMGAVITLGAGKTCYDLCSSSDNYDGLCAMTQDDTYVYVACTDTTIMRIAKAGGAVTSYGVTPAQSAGSALALYVSAGYLYAMTYAGVNAYNLTTGIAAYTAWPSPSIGRTGVRFTLVGDKIWTTSQSSLIAYDTTARALATGLTLVQAVNGYDPALGLTPTSEIRAYVGQRQDGLMPALPDAESVHALNMIVLNARKVSGGTSMVQQGVKLVGIGDVFGPSLPVDAGATGTNLQQTLLYSAGTTQITVASLGAGAEASLLATSA